MRPTFLFACLLIAGCSSANGNTPSVFTQTTATPDSIQVSETATAFLAAFDSLRWDEFRQYFADDATVFFPFSNTPSRVNGRAEIEAVFRRMFDQVRTGWQNDNRPGQPRLGLQPRDIQIQMMGDAAIVTFHLGDEKMPSRRTLVLRRSREGTWKIVHLHASPPPMPRGN